MAKKEIFFAKLTNLVRDEFSHGNWIIVFGRQKELSLVELSKKVNIWSLRQR
ncbi:167_t:CDS:1, partial [Entrophospora sp. SA101]